MHVIWQPSPKVGAGQPAIGVVVAAIEAVVDDVFGVVVVAAIDAVVDDVVDAVVVAAVDAVVDVVFVLNTAEV